MGQIGGFLEREIADNLGPSQFNAAIKAANTYRAVYGERYSGLRQCLWIVGQPGVGKSFYCRKFEPYDKQLNKWWDGY